MQKIRIITDSGADILPNAFSDITILPMAIRFGDTEYLDGVNLSHQAFYEKLVESDALPVTSLVSPAAFSDSYNKAVSAGETAIVITISGNLSGTYQSAVIAAEEFSGSVFVVDSKSVSIGQQILVLYAQALAQTGIDPQELVRTLEAAREHVHVLAVLDTLEYLKKGGRISKSVALVGGMLAIKPVVTVKDGNVVMIGKARGSRNGNNYLIQEIENSAGIDFSKPLRLGYTGLSDALLQKYIQDSIHLWENNSECMHISHIGATIGTHIGPGAIAVAFFARN